MTDAAGNTFVTFVLEQLSGLEGLGCRAMFGGHGLYRGPTFFGILFDGRLYFKTDGSTSQQYTRRGMGTFRPSERQVLASYYEVPADVLEARAELLRWAEAAARAAGQTASRQERKSPARAARE